MAGIAATYVVPHPAKNPVVQSEQEGSFVANAISSNERTETQKKSCCCSQQLVFLDMLEDLVRDRAATVLFVMFLVTMLVFSGTVFNPPPKHYVERLGFVSPPQYSLTIGIPSGRTPRLQVFMSDQFLPGQCHSSQDHCPKIHTTISNVVTNDKKSLDCSFDHLDDVKDTLEGERLRHVCATSVQNGVALSDSKGVAHFDNFAIDGPEGKYVLNFAADDAEITFQVDMLNPVVALVLKTGFLSTETGNMVFEVGTPLQVQPTIQVIPLNCQVFIVIMLLLLLLAMLVVCRGVDVLASSDSLCVLRCFLV